LPNARQSEILTANAGSAPVRVDRSRPPEPGHDL
jgi:hypothetical protein